MAQLKSTEITGDLLVTNKIDTTVIDASNEIRLNGSNILSQIPVATASTIGGVKSGGNITIATSGNVTVNNATNAVTAVFANKLLQSDTRNVIEAPSTYITTPGQIIEFKSNSVIGLSVAAIYSQVWTIIPWIDGTGGLPIQIAHNAYGMFKRLALSTTEWSSTWIRMLGSDELGAASGIATLDSAGLLNFSQIPVASDLTMGGVKSGGNISINTTTGVMTATPSASQVTVTANSNLGGYTNLQSVLNYIANVFAGTQNINALSASNITASGTITAGIFNA